MQANAIFRNPNNTDLIVVMTTLESPSSEGETNVTGAASGLTLKHPFLELLHSVCSCFLSTAMADADGRVISVIPLPHSIIHLRNVSTPVHTMSHQHHLSAISPIQQR